MGDDLKMSDQAARPIIERFTSLSHDLDNAIVTSSGAAGMIGLGCGEFAPSVQDASDGFRLSWNTTYSFCGETAQLIAGNTNVFDIDLTRLDADLALPDLSGGP